MIDIERLNLKLPAGFEARAANIARELAAALTPLESLGPMMLERLVVNPVRVALSASDKDIALLLAQQILRSTRAEQR